MRLFNAFQIVVLFAAWPFLVGWLAKGPFPYSGALSWVAVAAFVFHFGCMVAATYKAIGGD